MPGISVSKIPIPFNKGGFSYSSYWATHSDFWFKTGTRSGLTLPDAQGNGDASILLPMVDASRTSTTTGVKLDTGITPVANTVIAFKGRATALNDGSFGLDSSGGYFFFGIASSKWRVGFANKTGSSTPNADTDYHTFILYDGKAWIRSASLELTDAAILNVIATVTPDCACVDPAWNTLTRTFWFASINTTYTALALFEYSCGFIGTIAEGAITWQKRFIFNNIYYGYDTVAADGSIAWTQRAAGSPTNPVLLINEYGSDYCLDNGHTLLRSNATEVFISVPHLVSGVANSTVANPTGYETVGTFSAAATGVNYTDCIIEFTNDFFDRSSEIIWSAICRASAHYDAANPKRFHVSEMDFNKFNVYLNEGYTGRLFIKTSSNSMDYYQWTVILEIILATENKTGTELNNILGYTNDYTAWSYPLWKKSTFATADIQTTLNRFAVTGSQANDMVEIGTDYGDADDKWNSGILAPNGSIYCAPFAYLTNMLKINPADDTTSLIPITTSVGISFKWRGGAITDKGISYWMPFAYTKFLKFDTTNNSQSEIDTDGAGANFNWGSAVFAQNGMIYGIPWDEPRFLKLNPSDDSVSYFGEITGTSKFSGAVLAPNGFIYCIPLYYTAIAKINPVNDAVTEIGTFVNFYKWWGAVITASGIIYAMPYNETRVLKIDTNTDEISYISIGATVYGENYSGAVLLPSGKILGIPHKHTAFILIDPSDDSVSYFGEMVNDFKYYSGVLAPNGYVYCPPQSADATKVLKVLSGLTLDRNMVLSRVINKH